MCLWMLLACPPPAELPVTGTGTGGEFGDPPPGRGRIRFLSGASLAAGESWEQAVFAEVAGDEPGDHLGAEVVAVGDLNGDGLDEIVLTVRDTAHLLSGAAIAPGGAVPTSSLDSLADHWSRPVGRVGDITGDGIPDVAVDHGGPGTQVWSGAELLGPAPSSVWFTWGYSGDGFTLQPAGDLDGDGVDDLLMDRTVATGAWETSALLGPITSDIVADAVQSTRLLGAPARLRAVGDLDADGRTDLAEVDPSDDGVVLVYFGSDLASAPARVVLPGDAAPAAAVFAPRSDLDGDGADELWVLVDDEERRAVAFSRPGLAEGLLLSPPDLQIHGWIDVLTPDRSVVTIAPAASSIVVSLHPSPDLDGSTLVEGDAAHAWTVGVTEGWHLGVAGDLDGDGVEDLVLAEPEALPDRTSVDLRR